MVEHGKDYFVTKLDGESEIRRGGLVVGTWPNIGFTVMVPSVGTIKTGTELRAHAYAEVALNVPASERQWVMSAEEYAEDERILAEHKQGLLAKYPLTPELEASLSSWRNPTESDLVAEDLRLQLLNTQSGQIIPHRPRPARFPDPIAKPRIDQRIGRE